MNGRASLLVCGVLAWPCTVGAVSRLPALTVDLADSSVSGLSSGAYMAGQFHVAFSSTVSGAAIVAGGPYGCAQGQLSRALNQCTGTLFGLPAAEALLESAKEREQHGAIAPLANLRDDRVYVFSGTEDDTVAPAVVDQTVELYRRLGIPDTAIRYVDDRSAGHALITEDAGASCGATESPFINDCDYDQAGDLLEHLYGALEPPVDTPDGELLEFDQAEFLPEPTEHGLNNTGFVYIPEDCARGETCRTHIVFHGCKQTTELIGDRFRTTTGYRRWADRNRLIILYPEAHATFANPNSCWDWWGYDDPNHATRRGRQMAAVHAMLLRLAGRAANSRDCPQYTALNWRHWREDRAHVCGWWWFCASGSGESIGLAWTTTTLYQRQVGEFGTEACSV